ncbi:hypothetical protein QYF36_023469 [Acer negundo]|nr:hypothetical protein QYF36_023469 [Acer negundo]
MVLSWINGSLLETILATVARCSSAQESWVRLEERFASQNQQFVVGLRYELMNTRRVSDSDLITIVMSNVGPLFENTVVVAQARETPISFTSLEVLLKSAEPRLLTVQTPAPDMSTAMYTARGGHHGG